MSVDNTPVTYLDAGVDVEAGNQLIQRLKTVWNGPIHQES